MTINLKDINQINILGEFIKLIIDPNLLMEKSLFGEFSPVNNEIRIYGDDTEHHITTLIHEILEVINTKLELDLEHGNITRLSQSIFQVLNSNDDLLEYLYNKMHILGD